MEAGLPEATLMLLATGEPAAASRAKAGSQQLGETLAEAEKRELRARKGAISAEADSSWQAWRSLHPRMDASLEGNKDVDVEVLRVEDLDDPFYTFTLPAQPEEWHKPDKRWKIGGLIFGPTSDGRSGGAFGRFQSMKTWMKRGRQGHSAGRPA
ncbi:ANK3 [Symbiodinium natans]|uniref:ANK3 protein n=1 Tax=Symbiodinium natans TaxID=878477 RepID=A0A812IDB6_9DINO|nr:ANK3 [Symbiodinium natans]